MQELATHLLGHKDFLGYNFEMSNLEVLKKHKLYKFVKYRNPKKPYSWKRKRGVGVDMVLKVEDHVFYVEESFQASNYWYRRHWFKKSRLKRFKGYPQDGFHHWVILTNRTQNFKGLSDLAKKCGIKILSINGVLTLIRNTIKAVRTFCMSSLNSSSLVSYCLTRKTQNNVYTYEKDPVKRDPRIYVGNPKHEEWLQESLNRLKKVKGYFEFSL